MFDAADQNRKGFHPLAVAAQGALAASCKRETGDAPFAPKYVELSGLHHVVVG